MALTTDQLRNLSRLYDRWQSGDASARDAVQREVYAAGADVARGFAQMFAHAHTESAAPLLPPISQAMREAAVLAAGKSNAGNGGGAINANSTRFGTTLSDEVPSREPGQRIGPYRLIKELGRGGMGVVWLAERADGQHSRQVALKMPLVENLNWLLAARFARERNILASLEHPSIARLYDAGVDEKTQPYIAIEYVQGQPITEFVKAKRLKPEATAQLFIRVIEAVAHAHTQLVIHRDIKPSNILVDAKGEPHLLDFGIAKLLDDEESQSADATQLTRLSGRALTLDYASPEQVNNASLGTASDVYSLGIVLYELLTGRRPYNPKGSTRRDLEQAILDQDPSKPSDQLLMANTGDSESGKSARRMRGDLDTVVLKALRKDPKQRYATAQAFADDLKRYLAYEPIAAKPDAGWYRVGRFVRRNRWAVSTGAAIFLLLAVGVVVVSLQAVRIEQRRIEAELAKVQALEALTDSEASAYLLRSVLTNSSGATTSAELLAAAQALIEQLYASHPVTRARLQLDVADMLISRSEFQSASVVLEQAEQSARQATSADLIAKARCTIAENNGRRGQLTEAGAELNRIISQYEETIGAQAEGLTSCLISRAIFHSERGSASAAVLADASLALSRIKPRPGTLSTRTYLMSLLAETHIQSGNFGDGILQFRQALALLDASGQGEVNLASTVRGGLSMALSEAGQTQEALSIALRSFEVAARDGRSYSRPAVVNYASLLRDVGRFDESESLLARALFDAKRAAEPQAIAFATVHAGRTACAKKIRAICTALSTEALALLQRQVGPRHPVIATAMTARGIAHLLDGELVQAVAMLEDAKGRYASASGARIRGVLAMSALAETHASAGNMAAARENALQAVALAGQSMHGFTHSEWMGRALLALARVELAAQRGDVARGAAASSVAHLHASLGENAPESVDALRLSASPSRQ